MSDPPPATTPPIFATSPMARLHIWAPMTAPSCALRIASWLVTSMSLDSAGQRGSYSMSGCGISANLILSRYYDTPTQLSAGVRLVTAQVHKDNNQWRLCHSYCSLLDAGLLSDWLGSIKSWLDEHPNEGMCSAQRAAQDNLGAIELIRTSSLLCSRHNHPRQLRQRLSRRTRC